MYNIITVNKIKCKNTGNNIRSISPVKRVTLNAFNNKCVRVRQ